MKNFDHENLELYIRYSYLKCAVYVLLHHCLITAVFKLWNATEHHQFILGPPGKSTAFAVHVLV